MDAAIPGAAKEAARNHFEANVLFEELSDLEKLADEKSVLLSDVETRRDDIIHGILMSGSNTDQFDNLYRKELARLWSKHAGEYEFTQYETKSTSKPAALIGVLSTLTIVGFTLWELHKHGELDELVKESKSVAKTAEKQIKKETKRLGK